ncbi:MAG: NAD(P)H-hydrate dehydratase [Chloroflexota bacterium]
MKVVTAQEMREIDRITIQDYGVPSLVLMERAGLSVALKIRERFSPRKVLVLCGGGNNGGDGLVVARNLHNWGYRVSAAVFSEESRLSSDCATQYRIARAMGVHVAFRKTLRIEGLHGAVVVDAILGTGLSKPVTGELAAAFALLNDSSVPVFAVDIPSGISADTGEVLGAAVQATCTVTFGLPKRGHLLYPGAAHSGELHVEDIGFPATLLAADSLKVSLIDRSGTAALLPHRQRYSHKGDYGHVLIVAGSRGKTGAALLAARASLRCGSGLVTIAFPESLSDIFQARVTDEMTLPLPDDGRGTIAPGAAGQILTFVHERKIDALAVGPGIGVSEGTEEVVAGLIENSPVPVVIDADGLNSVRADLDLLRRAKSSLVLTPHPGEMSRLLPPERGLTIQDIERARIDLPLSFSAETSACLVLKGVPTVVAAPDGRAFINTTGNPGMATGGSGDVLTGIIASLIGQRLSPSSASVLGVYLHGLAGDEASKEKGEHSLIATDIAENLPAAFRSLLRE